MGRVWRGAAIVVPIFWALPALSAEAVPQGAIDPANTAWLLTASALVLFMTLPGLALFYAGLVRSQNVLSVVMHCFAIAALVSLLWFACGYAIAFGDPGGWWGGLAHAFMAGKSGLDRAAAGTTVPEPVFFMFQLTFAVITPALIVGAYVERIRFGAMLLFSGLWLLVVYAPVCHWIWGSGWLADMGAMDFAGGIVVHATAGTTALLAARVIGPRRGFPNELVPPHSPGLTAAGAGMLWVGWYGFNAGSALAADGNAGLAMMTTHLSASSAALVWAVMDKVRFGKPSVVGLVTGVIAGLAAITPASGFIGPAGAVLVGAIAAIVCHYATTVVKFAWRIDDSLDVFAVHGVGGILGSILVAVLASPALGGLGTKAGAVLPQLGVQLLALAAAIVWSALASMLILKVAGTMAGGLRVDEETEIQGLDIVAHGERGYDLR